MRIRAVRLLLIASISSLLFAITPASFASGGGGGPSYEEGKPNYVVLEPIVVNLRDGSRMRFMQVKMQVLTKSVEAIHALEHHKPVVTDALLMLLAHQDADTMRDIQGRERVRKEALYTLQKVLAEHAGIGTIKAAEGGHGSESAVPAAPAEHGGGDSAEHGAAAPAEAAHEAIDSPIEALYFTDFVIQ